jgi:hypothetical protein
MDIINIVYNLSLLIIGGSSLVFFFNNLALYALISFVTFMILDSLKEAEIFKA